MARFMDPNDVLRSRALTYDPKDPGGKILFGEIDEQLVGIDDNRHIMTVAGNRAGKSVTLIGNLLNYRGSAMVNDCKGELAERTAIERAALGQAVYVLDPFHIVRGAAAQFRARYNPMKRLTLENPYIIEDALQITDGLIVSSGSESDPHWNESAGQFIMGVILLVSLSPQIAEPDRNLVFVGQLIKRALQVETLPAESGDEEIRYYTLLRAAQDCEALLHEQGSGDIGIEILDAIQGFYEKGTEERGSVLSTARRHTQFLSFPSMKQVLTGHDVELEDLKRMKSGVTIYMVLPATKMNSCNRWLRLQINQLFDAMERERELPGVPVLLALDEFPILGYMKQLESAAGQIAAFGLRMWVILQDWGQGKALYKERFESFAANAGILQFFGNTDLTTTEYVSKKLGQTLIQATRKSETTIDQRAQGLKGELDNMQQYPLMTPDEISRTFSREDPQQRQLILWAGYRPIIMSRHEYFKRH